MVFDQTVNSDHERDNIHRGDLASAKKNLHNIGKEETYFEGKQLTADSNYHSYNNLLLCKGEQINAYIPDIQFRKRDPHFAEQERFKDGVHGRQRPDVKPGLFTSADFSFDATKQVYLCPQGKELTCHGRNQVNRYRTNDVYHARPEDCATCPMKARCLCKSTTSRRYLSIPVDMQEPNLIDAMKAKIDTEQGRRIARPGCSMPGMPGDLGLSSRSLPISVSRSA